jgi:hypothetical protein
MMVNVMFKFPKLSEDVVGNINSTKSIEIDRMQKTLRLITPQNV